MSQDEALPYIPKANILPQPTDHILWLNMKR
jgi:hypothetical protein